MARWNTRLVAALMFAVALAISLAACAPEPSPTDVARDTLEALKAQDFDTLQQNYAGSADDLNIANLAGSVSGMDLSSYTDEQTAMVKQILDVMTSFDYELGAESVNGDAATVQATVTTYDLGTVFSESMKEYFTEALGTVFSGSELSSDDMTALFADIFGKKLAEQAEKSHVATTTLSLSKVDGAWKMDAFTQENLDAFMGGMVSGIEDFASNLAGLSQADTAV